MRSKQIMSAIASNRKRFYELVAELEQACNCCVDEERLTGVIDSDFDGREELTIEEAHGILLAVSCHPGGSRRT